MATRKRVRQDKLCGQKARTQSLDDVVQQTSHLWRKHHLGYDQTKYVVERVRRRLVLEPPRMRTRTVARLEYSEVERLIQVTYRSQSKYALMIKTLFLTGARVDEFVHIRVEDLLVDGNPPQIHLTHAKRGRIATYRSYQHWRMSCARISRGVKGDSCLRATGIRVMPPARSKRSSQHAPAPLASRNASIRTFSGIPSRPSCWIPGLFRLIRSRSFWDTCIFRPRRSMPKQACEPWATTTSARSEGSNSPVDK
jgi:hypothetical protein